MKKIKISEDFSKTPGGRLIIEGDYSGEEFREKILLPKFEEAEKNKEELLIDFNDTYGFATSFLEEAFGGLVRKYNKENVLKVIKIKSDDDETVPLLINKYVKAAEDKKRK